jgi:NADPH2:quinone reductase
MPVPSATDVIIRQTAFGVNFIDVYFRSGLYPWPVEKDLILGSEGAGVVEAVGSGFSNFSIGDRVAYTVPNGGYATYRLVPSTSLVHLPDHIDDKEAAAGGVLSFEASRVFEGRLLRGPDLSKLPIIQKKS